jgi:hypothetical protein
MTSPQPHEDLIEKLAVEFLLEVREREGENEYYFREFSEKKAYPLMINLLFWVLTH